MGISGDDEVRFDFHGTGEEHVVGRVIGDSVYRIEALGNDCLSEDESKEPPDRFISGVKSFLNSRILKHAANFPENLYRGCQLKVPIDPEILKSSREGILAKESADKEVGIDNRPKLLLQVSLVCASSQLLLP